MNSDEDVACAHCGRLWPKSAYLVQRRVTWLVQGCPDCRATRAARAVRYRDQRRAATAPPPPPPPPVAPPPALPPAPQLAPAALPDLADGVGAYLRAIGAIPLLTPEEERALFVQLAAGDQRAREHLAVANLRLVISWASRCRNRGLPFLDLIQEGNCGLLTAIGKFDVTKGLKFSTYAVWWIRQAITRAIADNSRTIRLPVHMGERLSRLARVQGQLYTVLGREPTVTELAKEMGLEVYQVADALSSARLQPASLDAPVGDGLDADPLGAFVPDAAPAIIDQAEHSALAQDLARVLSRLDERERQIIRLRYGLADGHPHTLEEVGAVFGITRERIRQIEAKALKKLRHPAFGGKLRSYLEASYGT